MKKTAQSASGLDSFDFIKPQSTSALANATLKVNVKAKAPSVKEKPARTSEHDIVETTKFHWQDGSFFPAQSLFRYQAEQINGKYYPSDDYLVKAGLKSKDFLQAKDEDVNQPPIFPSPPKP